MLLKCLRKVAMTTHYGCRKPPSHIGKFEVSDSLRSVLWTYHSSRMNGLRDCLGTLEDRCKCFQAEENFIPFPCIVENLKTYATENSIHG
jgi:hypothetical protein